MREIRRTMVVGCGGIGGIVAARLHEAGHAVTAVTANAEIAEAITAQGLVVALGDDAVRGVRFPAVVALEPGVEPFDLCILATPPNAALTAAQDALPFLREGSPILCLPNGLIEERLAATLDPTRLIGGVVGFGARMLAPGRVALTAAGSMTLGRLDAAAQPDDDLEAVTALMAAVGPVHRAENLRGARWSKLAINCAISTLGTIGGDRLGVLMRHRFVRRLALEVMTEVVEVARVEGVRLEKVSGTLDLEWMALSPGERARRGSPSLLAKHTVLLAVGARYRKLRSSMLAAIERGRVPPVDFLNGEIVDRGVKLDIATPINSLLQKTVHEIASGAQRSSVETLRRVYREGRDRLQALEDVG